MVLLINYGRGSLDFARRLLTLENSDEEPQPDPTNNVLPGWCICNNCIQMPTPEENKCCRRRECITSYELFQNLCIDRHVLELAIRARCAIRVEPLDFSSPVSARLHIGSSFCGNTVIWGREIGELYHPVLSKKWVNSILPLIMFIWVSWQSKFMNLCPTVSLFCS